MWFYLCLSRMSTPLGCMVGADGQLYWRLVDLATLMNVSSPHAYANKVPDCVLGEEKLPPTLHFNSFTKHSKLVDTHRALELLQGHQETAQRFASVLMAENPVKVFVAAPSSSRSKKHFDRCIRLVACERDGQFPFIEWSMAYVQKTLMGWTEQWKRLWEECSQIQPASQTAETSQLEMPSLQLECSETSPAASFKMEFSEMPSSRVAKREEHPETFHESPAASFKMEFSEMPATREAERDPEISHERTSLKRRISEMPASRVAKREEPETFHERTSVKRRKHDPIEIRLPLTQTQRMELVDEPTKKHAETQTMSEPESRVEPRAVPSTSVLHRGLFVLEITNDKGLSEIFQIIPNGIAFLKENVKYCYNYVETTTIS